MKEAIEEALEKKPGEDGAGIKPRPEEIEEAAEEAAAEEAKEECEAAAEEAPAAEEGEEAPAAEKSSKTVEKLEEAKALDAEINPPVRFFLRLSKVSREQSFDII